MYDFLDDSLIICNNNQKENILRHNHELKELKNYTFYTLNSFKEAFYFKLTTKAYLKTMELYNCSYENSVLIADNLYYLTLESKNYHDEKLTKLINLKKTLMDLNLLEINPFFKHFLKRKKVYVLEPVLDNFEVAMFKEVEELTEVIYEDFNLEKRKQKLYEFQNGEEEVNFVFQEIRKLLDQGVSIDKIVIANSDSYYNHLIRRYSYFYDISVDLDFKTPITSNSVVKEFLEAIKNNKSYEEIADTYVLENSYDVEALKSELDELKTTLRETTSSLKHRLSAEETLSLETKRDETLEKLNSVILKLDKTKNQDIKEILINLMNDNLALPLNLRYEVLKAKLSKINYPHELVKNAVKVINDPTFMSDDIYVFLINVTNGTYPVIHKDDLYLGDEYQAYTLITKTSDLNELALKKAVFSVSSLKNLTLSYSLKTSDVTIPSSLIRILDLEVINPKVDNNYSAKLSEVEYGIMLDEFINFQHEDAKLKAYYGTFKERYKTFDNRFNGVNKDLISLKLKNKISLSYSSVSSYFKCQFAYFLEHVLKIKKDTTKEATLLGNAYHEILEHLNRPDFNLEMEKEKALLKMDTNKLKFYFLKFWDDFNYLLEFIKETKEFTSLTKELHEQEINLTFPDDLYDLVFKGYIDKIIYNDELDKDYLAIIDYKTGNSQEATMDNLDIGLNLQLPIYAYLIYKSGLFKNPDLLGLYLQYVFTPLTKEMLKNKTVSDAKWQNFKLNGYSTNDLSKLSILDKSYQSSAFIKGLKTKKDGGFYSSCKLISEEEINKLVLMVNDLIIEAFNGIMNGEFKINPKMMFNPERNTYKNVSCEYCIFKDHCFKTKRDEEVHDKKSCGEILGGEI